MLQPWMVVALGGAIGSMLRHGANVVAARSFGHPSYVATLAVNVAGCAVIGFLAGQLSADRITMTATARLFVFVGLLGGFTTFSSFGLETFALARAERVAEAGLNVGLQVIGGLAAVAAGFAAGQRL